MVGLIGRTSDNVCECDREQCNGNKGHRTSVGDACRPGRGCSGAGTVGLVFTCGCALEILLIKDASLLQVCAYHCVVCDTDTSAVCSAVPVRLVIAETLADGDSLVAKLGDGREHVLGQVVGSLVKDIVTDGEPLVTIASGCAIFCDVALEPVLGVLNILGLVLVVVVRVDVEVGDVVAQISQVLLTTGVGGTC